MKPLVNAGEVLTFINLISTEHRRGLNRLTGLKRCSEEALERGGRLCILGGWSSRVGDRNRAGTREWTVYRALARTARAKVRSTSSTRRSHVVLIVQVFLLNVVRR